MLGEKNDIDATKPRELSEVVQRNYTEIVLKSIVQSSVSKLHCVKYERICCVTNKQTVYRRIIILIYTIICNINYALITSIRYINYNYIILSLFL